RTRARTRTSERGTAISFRRERVREFGLRPETERGRRGLGAEGSRYLPHIGSPPRQRPRRPQPVEAQDQSPKPLLDRRPPAHRPGAARAAQPRRSLVATHHPPSVPPGPEQSTIRLPARSGGDLLYSIFNLPSVSKPPQLRDRP